MTMSSYLTMWGLVATPFMLGVAGGSSVELTRWGKIHWFVGILIFMGLIPLAASISLFGPAIIGLEQLPKEEPTTLWILIKTIILYFIGAIIPMTIFHGPSVLANKN